MGGYIDLFATRRTYNEVAHFWKATEEDTETLMHKKKSDGSFYCKEESSFMKQNQIVNGMFMCSDNSILIKTEDLIETLSENDIVKFREKVWIVQSIQRKTKNKQTEFLNKPSYITYIQLKG